MNFKHIVRIAAVVIAGAATQLAHATPVNWTFSGHGSFNIGLFGTFTYDADTNAYSNAAMHLANNSLTYGINSGDANSLTYGTVNGTGLFTLNFASPLTNAGGSIAVDVLSKEFGNPVHHTGTVTAPTTSVASPAPEAGSFAMAGLGLLWAGVAFRRAQARKQA